MVLQIIKLQYNAPVTGPAGRRFIIRNRIGRTMTGR